MFIAGCIVGSMVGGLTGVFMMCLVVAGKREDEQMARLLQDQKRERKLICFTDSGERELFWLPDGESIQLTAGDGERQACICRYEDEGHMWVNDRLWQMKEFARQMEKRGITYHPV